MTNPKMHWEAVYAGKAVGEVSWYQSRSTHSLALIKRFARQAASRILDVGCGASVLVDELVEAGFTNLVALDVSEKALSVTRQRLGHRASVVEWIVSDITEAELASRSVEIWHDRAVFHFLVDLGARQRYVDRLREVLMPGGTAVIATFAPDGPTRCSGLEVVRYSAADICAAFGSGFELVASEQENHRTPSGSEQRFVYACCRKI